MVQGDSFVHHDRDASKERSRTRAFVRFLRRQDFPFGDDYIGLRAHIIGVRPSKRSRELTAATSARCPAVMVRNLFFSRSQKKRPAIFIGKKRTIQGSQPRRS